LEIFDELGLSAKDVETLHNIFISELQKMTDAGQRYGEVSEITPVWERSWNNSMGMIGRGAPYMDCKAQTVEMISRMRRYALDDQWMLTPDSALGHTWGVAISNNPSDPPVWFDTRASNMSVGKPCSTCIGWGGFFTKGSNFGTAGTPGNIPGKSKK